MPVEAPPWIYPDTDICLASQSDVCSLVTKIPAVPGETLRNGNSGEEEVFAGLAQWLRTNPAFLNAFLADRRLRFSVAVILLDDDAADRLKMAVCAQDFLALKSVINPGFLAVSPISFF